MEIKNRTKEELNADYFTKKELLRIFKEKSNFYDEYNKEKNSLSKDIFDKISMFNKLFFDVVSSKLSSTKKVYEFKEGEGKLLGGGKWSEFKSIVVSSNGIGLIGNYRENANYQDGYSYLNDIISHFKDKVYSMLSEKGKEYLDRFMKYYVTNNERIMSQGKCYVKELNLTEELKAEVTKLTYLDDEDKKKYSTIPVCLYSTDWEFCKITLCSQADRIIDERGSYNGKNDFSKLDIGEIDSIWNTITEWILLKEQIRDFKDEEIAKLKQRNEELQILLTQLNTEFNDDLTVLALKENKK